MKKKTTTEKTAIQITPNQKATTTVANVAGKVKTGAFGVATGAGIAGTMMMQNERGIRNRKARAEYHKKVGAVCTVAVGAAVVGAGAAIVQSIFDPVIDVSMLEIEPDAYVELNDKGSEIQEKAAQKSEAAEHVEDEGAAEDSKTDVDPEQNADQHVEKVVAEIVRTEQPVSAPKAAEKPIVEATATEVQTPDPKDDQPASADPAPVAPQAEQPVAPAPAAPAEKPADSAAATQTNQGNNAQDAKSQTGEQKPKDNGQGASNNNPKNGNNHAKAAK
jgi:hypothetical protein